MEIIFSCLFNSTTKKQYNNQEIHKKKSKTKINLNSLQNNKTKKKTKNFEK